MERHHPRAGARPSGVPTHRAAAPATWVGVGGSPESIVRAARHGLPLMLAIIGGVARPVRAVRRPVPPCARPVRSCRSYRSASTRPATSPTPTSRRSTSCGPTGSRCATASAPSAGGRPSTRAEFDQAAGPDGALHVGSPETVARKIAATVDALGAAPLRHEVLRGHAAARDDDAQHRAVRHRGRPTRARAAGVEDRRCALMRP